MIDRPGITRLRLGDGNPGPVTRVLLQEFRKLAAVDGPEIFPAAGKVAAASRAAAAPGQPPQAGARRTQKGGRAKK